MVSRGYPGQLRTCLGSRLQKAPLSNILCQFGGAIHKVNYPKQHCLFSFISNDAFFCHAVRILIKFKRFIMTHHCHRFTEVSQSLLGVVKDFEDFLVVKSILAN